jgi:hypothetical protein
MRARQKMGFSKEVKQQKAELGYMMFITRFRGFALGNKKLLEDVNEKNWHVYHHSIAIIGRASMLDCLYIMAWNLKGNDIINSLLADSIDNVLDNEYWRFNDGARRYLSIASEYFSVKRKNKISPKKLVSIIGSEAEPFYLLYDLYSKFDHFSILDSFAFKTTTKEQLKYLDHTVTSVLIILQMLYKKFESGETLDNLIEILIPSQEGTHTP